MMSPYIIECADKRSIVFDYDVIRLWEVESEWILKRQIIPLYILLPGTKSPQVDLLKQALHEIAQMYDHPQLAYRFVWFYRLAPECAWIYPWGIRIKLSKAEVSRPGVATVEATPLPKGALYVTDSSYLIEHEHA